MDEWYVSEKLIHQPQEALQREARNAYLARQAIRRTGTNNGVTQSIALALAAISKASRGIRLALDAVR